MIRTFVVAVGVAAFLASPAAAQEMPAGSWTGSVTQPDGMSFDVGFEVSGKGSELAIALVPPRDSGAEDQRFPFDDIELTPESLTFTWDMGVELECALEPRPGGAWAGTCTDARGQEGGIVMIPPGED